MLADAASSPLVRIQHNLSYLPPGFVERNTENHLRPVTVSSNTADMGLKHLNAEKRHQSDYCDFCIDEYARIVVSRQYGVQMESLCMSLTSSELSKQVVVGRIVISTGESTTIHIETSRRIGRGIKIRLDLSSYKLPLCLFPGQIVAFRGRLSNATLSAEERLLNRHILAPGK